MRDNVKGRMARKRFAKMQTDSPTGDVILDAGKDIDITGRDLNRALREQPGLRAWYGDLYALAKKSLREAKHEEKNVAEDLDLKIRRRLLRDKNKVTETEIKKQIARHPRMREAWKVRMDWEYKVDRLSEYLQAVEQRMKALQSIGANKREETGHKDSV